MSKILDNELVENVLRSRMLKDFIYSTADVCKIFYKSTDPDFNNLKIVRKFMFQALREGVVEHVERFGMHFWYIGKPTLKQSKICNRCYGSIWTIDHGECDRQKMDYDESMAQINDENIGY